MDEPFEPMCEHQHYPAAPLPAVQPCPDNDDLACCGQCHGEE